MSSAVISDCVCKGVGRRPQERAQSKMRREAAVQGGREKQKEAGLKSLQEGGTGLLAPPTRAKSQSLQKKKKSQLANRQITTDRRKAARGEGGSVLEVGEGFGLIQSGFSSCIM